MDQTLQELQAQLEDLRLAVKELKSIQKENSFSVNLLAKKKLERLLTKSPGSLEAERVRLRSKVDDEQHRELRLREYLETSRQQLAAEKQEFSQLAASHDGPVEELLGLDCEENASRYFRLLDQKRFIEEQARSAESLQKRYAEAFEKELAQLRGQQAEWRARIEEQKSLAAVQAQKLAEAKAGFGQVLESQPSDTLASEEEHLPNSFVTSRDSLKKRLSIRSRATKPALSSERRSKHVSVGNLYGLVFGARGK